MNQHGNGQRDDDLAEIAKSVALLLLVVFDAAMFIAVMCAIFGTSH